MAAQPLNPLLAPVVRWAKTPLVGAVLGEEPSLEHSQFRWAGNGPAEAPGDNVNLLVPVRLLRLFDAKQVGFIVRDPADNGHGTQDLLREVKDAVVAHLASKQPIELSIGYMLTDAFPDLAQAPTPLYVGFLGCKRSVRQESQTLERRRVMLGARELYLFAVSTDRETKTRADAVAALVRYTQCTNRWLGNVKAAPITLAKNPGLPSPEEENAPQAADNGPGAPGGAAQGQAPPGLRRNPLIQKRHSQLDVELLRLESLLDVTADSYAGYVVKAEEYARSKMPSFWLKSAGKLRDQWREGWASQEVQLPPRMMVPLRPLVGYQRALFAECTKDPIDFERRILDVQGLFGADLSYSMTHIRSQLLMLHHYSPLNLTLPLWDLAVT